LTESIETNTVAAVGNATSHERWLRAAQANGFHDFLFAKDSFRRASRGRKHWTNRNKPGIYFWLADNGEAYVGQSVKPQSRLRQHMRDHGDIVNAAFRSCPKKHLNALERQLVKALEPEFKLRNIKFAVSTGSAVAFDAIVSPAEQKAFVEGGVLDQGVWQPLEEPTRIQARKFEKFSATRDSQAALRAVQLFVSRAIPYPGTTEFGFWSVSLYRSGFIRVNAGHQEVFTWNGPSKRVRVFSDKSLSLLRSWRAGYEMPSWVNFVRPASLDEWLSGSRLLSTRRLIVRLMRHTQALNSGSHCPQLLRIQLPGPSTSERTGQQSFL